MISLQTLLDTRLVEVQPAVISELVNFVHSASWFLFQKFNHPHVFILYICEV